MTDRKIYNKLVRDRIPEIIAADGRDYETEIMSDDDYRQALRNKILEEAQEVASASPDELIKELTDLYEVMDALITAYGVIPKDVRERQQARRDERGGFEKKIKLLWTE